MTQKKALLLTCCLLAFLSLLLQAPRVFAQAPTPSDDEVNRIAHQLYCPVCENTPLDVCPTEACRQWRDLIRQQLSQGWSEDRIKQYFQDQYGARVLAEPPRTGLNWMVYVLPPLIIAAGAILLLRAMRNWTKPTGGESSVPLEKEVLKRRIRRTTGRRTEEERLRTFWRGHVS